MLPLKDENISRTFPVVTVSLIVFNFAVFIYQYFIGSAGFEYYVMSYGLTPYKLMGQAPVQMLEVRHIAQIPEFMKIFTSMFMHGGFLHIISNMWILWIFGDNVEDSMGKFKFLVFYILSGVAATLAHVFFNMNSSNPLVGASGAIAGVMGAYMILFPRAKVLTLIIIFIFIRIVRIPAAFFLGFWFLLQLLYSPIPGQQVAYLAHVGGFAAGITMVFFLAKRRKRGFRVISVK